MTPPSDRQQHVEPEGTAATRWLNAVTVETVYRGFVTLKLVQRAEADFMALLQERPVYYRLVDTSAMTGSEPTIKGGVEEIWNRFKAHGGREILFISTAPITKMQGSVAAMHESVRIRFFDTRSKALEYLATLTA
jgi:hypothetical protein